MKIVEQSLAELEARHPGFIKMMCDYAKFKDELLERAFRELDKALVDTMNFDTGVVRIDANDPDIIRHAPIEEWTK